MLQYLRKVDSALNYIEKDGCGGSMKKALAFIDEVLMLARFSVECFFDNRRITLPLLALMFLGFWFFFGIRFENIMSALIASTATLLGLAMFLLVCAASIITYVLRDNPNP